MNNLTILLAITKSGAILEILLLLLVAVIIGYVTAMLYYKSVYGKQILTAESEKADLKTRD
jgi:uncharacterized protein (UPF0333 family)